MQALAVLVSGCTLVAAVTGCSDEEDQPGRSVTVRPDETVELAADEYRFDPGRIVVEAAGRNIRLRFVMSNEGSLAHNLRVRAGERELAAIQSFPPDEQRPLSVNLEPGSYDFVCTVADHEELGMTGELEVK